MRHAASVPEARGDERADVGLRRRRRDVEACLADGVHERANQLRAADGRAVARPNARDEAVEEDDLPIEEHHRHLRPFLIVNGGTVNVASAAGGGEIVEWEILGL